MIYVKGVLATTAAAAAIVMAAMWMSGESDRDETDMRPVLQEVAMAQTLHLQITVNGEAQQAWVRRPGQLRIAADPLAELLRFVLRQQIIDQFPDLLF